MPRQAQIRFLSPDDPKLRKKRDTAQLIPVSVVRGVIRGLLNHLWSNDRRKTKESGVSQERVERRLMTLVQFAAKQRMPKGQKDDLLSKSTASWVPRVFGELTGHTYFVLNADSDLILKEFTPYKALPTVKQRQQWLQQAVPRLLASLKQGSACTAPTCYIRTRPPDEDVLFEWENTRNVGELRDFILGYFHGLTKANVKRIRSSPP